MIDLRLKGIKLSVNFFYLVYLEMKSAPRAPGGWFGDLKKLGKIRDSCLWKMQ